MLEGKIEKRRKLVLKVKGGHVVCTVLDSMASYCPVGIIDCTIVPLWQVSGKCTLH
jgi:hypothetical protein